MSQLRFITIDPAHFHAALVHKENYPQVDSRCQLFAPLGNELIPHLQRLSDYNSRPVAPTKWEVEMYAGPDFLSRALQQPPGSIVVLAGRNAAKINTIVAAIEAGMHVLADKPWILNPQDLPKLQRALDTADARGLIAYDIMTERFEVTANLQGELVRDEAILGTLQTGSADEPAVYVESVHFLKKTVSGAPLRRPLSFFDVHEQGEALSDVGTHLVDLIPWMLYPAQGIDHQRDVRMLAAKRWPTLVSRSAFQQITGAADFPPAIASAVAADTLPYFCNSQVQYTLRGHHVKLDVLWNFEAEPGAGDTHWAVFRGSRSTVEIRQGAEEKFVPELYVIPNSTGDRPAVRIALEKKIAALQTSYPGVAIREAGERLHVTIPPALRGGHEGQFGQVTRRFLSYVQGEAKLPAWEKPSMLAKYFVTTTGVAMARG